MSNLKEQEEMKKILSAIAFAAIIAVSCSKELSNELETSSPSGKGNLVRITASLDDVTRTAYANGTTFSWIEDDEISVFTSDGNGYSFDTFYAESTGASSTFSATITDWYRPSGLAFYPSNLTPEYNSSTGEYSVTLSSQFRATGNDPLSLLPLIGIPNAAGDAYSFSSAAGILKFSFTNVPDNAYYFTIYTNDTGQSLCGQFKIGADNTISFDNHAGTAKTTFWCFASPDSNGEFVAYVPVPVGTLLAGTRITIEDRNEKALFETTTAKDIVVKRNTVIELKPLACPTITWNSLGTGKFYDSYFGMSANNFIEVEIEQNADDPAAYRIVNPYGLKFGTANADPYLTFSICKANDVIGYSNTVVPFDGIVSFDTHFTGYNMSSSGSDYLYIKSLNDYNGVVSSYITHSLVLKTKADGSPANIQLAPIYYGSSSGALYWGYEDNNLIQIAMPGEEFVDKDYLEVSATYLDNANGQANVAISVGEGLDHAVVGISALSLDDAANNANVVVDVSSVVSLNLPSEYGTFYVFVAGELNNYLFSSDSAQFSIAPAIIPDEYYKWIGSWSVNDGTDTDTWVISADQEGLTYRITGIWGYDSMDIPALFNLDYSISISPCAVYSSYYLYGIIYDGGYYLSEAAPTMIGILPDATGTSATLNGGDDSGFEIIGYYLTDSSYQNYGWRDLPATMTKIDPSSTASASRAPSAKAHKAVDSRKLSLEKNNHLTAAPARSKR